MHLQLGFLRGIVRLVPFPKLKSTLKRQSFFTIEQINTKSLKKLRAIPKTVYKKDFKEWKVRWPKCIISDGEIFGRDNILEMTYLSNTPHSGKIIKLMIYFFA